MCDFMEHIHRAPGAEVRTAINIDGQIYDRVIDALRRLVAKGWRIDEFEIYVADNLWRSMLLCRPTWMLGKVLDPDGMKVYLGGIRCHVDRSLDDNEIRLRQEVSA